MNKIFLAYLITFFIAAAGSVSAAAPRPIAYGGVGFGSSFDSVWSTLSAKYSRIGKIYGDKERGTTQGIVLRAQNFGDYTVTVYYIFKKNKLVTNEIVGHMYIESIGEKLKKYYERRYGKPERTIHRSIYHGGLRWGGTSEYTGYVWNLPYTVDIDFVKAPSGPEVVGTVSVDKERR